MGVLKRQNKQPPINKINEEEDISNFYKFGQYLGGGLEQDDKGTLAKDIYETAQGAAQGVVKQVRDIADLSTYALEYAPYALTPVQGVISAGGGIISGLAGDKDLDEALSFSTMMGNNRAIANDIKDYYGLEQVRETIHNAFEPAIQKLEAEYKSNMRRPSEIFGEFFSPVPMIRYPLAGIRAARISGLTDVSQKAAKIVRDEFTAQGIQNVDNSLLESPVKRLRAMKELEKKGTGVKLSSAAEQELARFTKNEKKLKELEFKNANLNRALRSEAVAGAMGAASMAYIETNVDEDLSWWLAPVAGITTAIAAPPLFIGHGRAIGYGLLGSYQKLMSERPGISDAAKQIREEKALDHFIRGRGLNPNDIRDSNGNILEGELKLQRKREILATSPNEIKFYTQLGKTLENLPEDKKEAVYNSLIYYQDLFEKFQRKAIERGDEAMADKFVPLIHNVLHIHGMKTLQQTLLDNVDAGMFLSPKRFFRNKLVSELDTLNEMQSAQIQGLGRELESLKMSTKGDDEFQIMFDEFGRLVKEADDVLDGSQLRTDSVQKGLSATLKRNVLGKEKNAGVIDFEMKQNAREAIDNFKRDSDVGLLFDYNNKADPELINKWGTSDPVKLPTILKKHYDEKGMELSVKAFNEGDRRMKKLEDNLFKDPNTGQDLVIPFSDDSIEELENIARNRFQNPANPYMMQYGNSAGAINNFITSLRTKYIENLIDNPSSAKSEVFFDQVSEIFQKAEKVYVNSNPMIKPQELQQQFSSLTNKGRIFKNLEKAADGNESAKRNVARDLNKMFIEGSDTPTDLIVPGVTDFLIKEIQDEFREGAIKLKDLARLRSQFMKETIDSSDPMKRFDSGEITEVFTQLFRKIEDDDSRPYIKEAMRKYNSEYKQNLLPFRTKSVYEQKKAQTLAENMRSNDAKRNLNDDQKAELRTLAAQDGTGGDKFFKGFLDPDVMNTEANVKSSLLAFKRLLSNDPQGMTDLKMQIKRSLGNLLKEGEEGLDSFSNKVSDDLLDFLKKEDLIDATSYNTLQNIPKLYTRMNQFTSKTTEDLFKTLQSDLDIIRDTEISSRRGALPYLQTVVKAFDNVPGTVGDKAESVANALVAKQEGGLLFRRSDETIADQDLQRVKNIGQYLDPEEIDNPVIQDFLLGEERDITPIAKIIRELDKQIGQGSEQAQKVKNAINDIFISAIDSRAFKKTSTGTNIGAKQTRVGGRKYASGYLDNLDGPALQDAVNHYRPFFEALYKNKTIDIRNPATGATEAVNVMDELDDIVNIAPAIQGSFDPTRPVTIKNMPTSNFSVDSILSRVYSVARGVVSARYVFSEYGIRTMRKGKAELLKKFLTDPTAVHAVHDVFVKGRTTSPYTRNFFQQLYSLPSLSTILQSQTSMDNGILTQYFDTPTEELQRAERRGSRVSTYEQSVLDAIKKYG